MCKTPVEVDCVLEFLDARKGALFKQRFREHGCHHPRVSDHLRELSVSMTAPQVAFVGTSQIQLQSSLAERNLIPSEIITTIVAYKIDEVQKLGPTILMMDGLLREPEPAH